MIITFCGHSKIYQTCEISKWLDIILPSLIEGGAATFYLGGYGDFDSLAAAAVRRQGIPRRQRQRTAPCGKRS